MVLMDYISGQMPMVQSASAVGIAKASGVGRKIMKWRYLLSHKKRICTLCGETNHGLVCLWCYGDTEEVIK